MTTTHLTLELWRSNRFELIRAMFHSANSNRARQCIRGKSSGAYSGLGSFQWTSAVKGLTALSIREKLRSLGASIPSVIEGRHKSLAASLDYAVSKRPIWLEEMFGSTSTGTSIAQRLLLRSNPNMKRTGPVAVSFNHHLLTGQQISILMNGKPVTEESLLFEVLAEIEGLAVDDNSIRVAANQS